MGTEDNFSSPWNNWITKGNLFVWMIKTIPVSFGFVVSLELKKTMHMYTLPSCSHQILFYATNFKKESVSWIETKVRKKRIKGNLKWQKLLLI